MEIIIIFFTVLAGLIGFMTYYKKFVEEPNSLKKHSIGKIESAKKTNNDFLIELTDYVQANNTSEQHFMQGFTFAESIKMLETYRDEAFSNENMSVIKKVKGNSVALEDVTKKAEDHILFLNQCKTFFRKNILNENWEYK